MEIDVFVRNAYMCSKRGVSVKSWWMMTFAFLLLWSGDLTAGESNWERRAVDWYLSGRCIKAVRYPADKAPPLLGDRLMGGNVRMELIEPGVVEGFKARYEVGMVVESVPLDGFVPWMALGVTDARSYVELDSHAYPEAQVTGNYLTGTPESDYAVGIFDTGASASLISHTDADLTGISDVGLVTGSPVILEGVTGTVTAYASHPLGIFVGGLNIIEPNGFLLDDSLMMGESNVSIIVGDAVESPRVFTAIGAPLAVYSSVWMCNNYQVSIARDGNEISAPYMEFYELGETGIPTYDNKIYLELRPSEVGYIWYFPCIEIPGAQECPDGDGSPMTPTIIADGWFEWQGLFFVSSVDVSHGERSSVDKDGFMFDTGAQVTVLSEAIAARLELNVNEPEFEVEITGATGETITAPGFYIDSLEITSSPSWLSYENVPIVVLDVKSPEGGYLDGIIGMNLFVDMNLVFNGGGLPGQNSPSVFFEPSCRVAGDVWPACGDCVVNHPDLRQLANHWLETSLSNNWYERCDLAPVSEPDEKIDFMDFAVLANNWLESVNP